MAVIHNTVMQTQSVGYEFKQIRGNRDGYIKYYQYGKSVGQFWQ